MTTALALLLIGFPAQGEAPPIPAPLKSIEFMRGKWDGMISYPSRDEKATMNMSCIKDVGNRYYRMTASAKGNGYKDTMAFITYDSAESKFKAWIFDSHSSAPVELTGDLKEKELILTSKVETVPKLGKVILRATWTNTSQKELGYRLEAKKGETWSTIEYAQYNRLR